MSLLQLDLRDKVRNMDPNKKAKSSGAKKSDRYAKDEWQCLPNSAKA